MKKDENLRLCGGTFFLLLLEARKQRKTAKDYYNGETDGLSELNTLMGLAKILVPDLQDPLFTMKNTLQGNTSEYKACKTEGGQYFCFADPAARSSFDSVVKENYQEALCRMRKFTHAFLEVGGSMKKDERLVRALVDLINRDNSISNETLFYINKDGSVSTKREIPKIDEVYLEPFLLGVWHFAVLRSEGNIIGKETFEFLCPPKGGGRRVYEGGLGENLVQGFDLINLGVPADVTGDAKKPAPDFEVIDDDNQEYVGQMGADENSFKGSQQQTIYNPTIFQQQGNHNVQIAHVEKLNMNDMWGGDDE
ncbi:MAG: hypothetical protein ACOYH0_00110 [Saccharofermentanales bacterium]|jgi:hypothetical protein